MTYLKVRNVFPEPSTTYYKHTNIFCTFCILGPKVEHFEKITPLDVFMKYIDTDVVDNILFQTNLYANHRERNFPPLSREEFYGFLTINFIMGYHELPSLSHYWKADQDLALPILSSTLPRNRFAQILSSLHLADSEAVPNNINDKLYKVRPLISAMNANYVKLYNVSQILSIDESMILFKGRHSIKQYCPKKPITRGINFGCELTWTGILVGSMLIKEKTLRNLG